MWLAGGGVKGGMAYGATDEFGYAAVEKKVHVHDLHATILHLHGHRPRTTDVPLQRPRFPADRCAPGWCKKTFWREAIVSVSSVH